jgi:hypothetical protein
MSIVSATAAARRPKRNTIILARDISLNVDYIPTRTHDVLKARFSSCRATNPHIYTKNILNFLDVWGTSNDITVVVHTAMQL